MLQCIVLGLFLLSSGTSFSADHFEWGCPEHNAQLPSNPKPREWVEHVKSQHPSFYEIFQEVIDDKDFTKNKRQIVKEFYAYLRGNRQDRKRVRTRSSSTDSGLTASPPEIMREPKEKIVRKRRKKGFVSTPVISKRTSPRISSDNLVEKSEDLHAEVLPHTMTKVAFDAYVKQCEATPRETLLSEPGMRLEEFEHALEMEMYTRDGVEGQSIFWYRCYTEIFETVPFHQYGRKGKIGVLDADI